MIVTSRNSLWPELAWAQWRETALTLQLWTQIVGKVRLALTPWLNHSWHVPFYVTARGLGTSPMPVGQEALEIEFDFIDHALRFATSRGERMTLELRQESVAAFYDRVRVTLAALDISVLIDTMPCEVASPIPFPHDHTHATYEPAQAHSFWRVLLQADRLFKQFRTGFLGKASPVHFFWGSFDLAVTRFSGRLAPRHPGGMPGLSDAITREAYSHELSSVGLWPGSDAYPHAAFYSYAYPEPPAFRSANVTHGSFDKTLGEFLLPYDAVRSADDPDAVVLEFSKTSYAAAADAGEWDRHLLECATGVPRVPRRI